MSELLDRLKTEDFELVIFAVASAEAQRSILEKRPEVQAIREAYKTGSLTEIEIRTFCHNLLQEYKPGSYFYRQEVFSAIAVALEPLNDSFVSEYIDDLAALKVAEMGEAARVARVCQKHRNFPKT